MSTDARGVWIGRGDSQRLVWIIEGEFVTDYALRRWVYANTEDGDPSRHVDVIRECHAAKYASRHRAH